MQTLRKLPTQAPTAKASPSASQPPSWARMASGEMPGSTAGTVTPASRTGQTRVGRKEAGEGPAAPPRRAEPIGAGLRADEVRAAGGRGARPRAGLRGARVARGHREEDRGAGRVA